MKSTKKFISIVLAVLMVMTSMATALTVNALSDGTLCDYYATNPNNQTGVQKTITIDGSFSDWSEDMMIAQSAAWDVANHYKGGHENCVLDAYALFASWDNNNLYVAWQMVNTTDTWADREGDGSLSDGGRILDVPLVLALNVGNKPALTSKTTDGSSIWGVKLNFDTPVDHLFYMSGKVGLGQPAMFTADSDNGVVNYSSPTSCQQFKNAGIKYAMAEGNVCSQIMGLNYSEDPDDVFDSEANWVDYKTFKGSKRNHKTSYDSFYEMSIPLTALGIDANYIQQNGIGAMLVATRGESGLDCVPFDATAMLDNALESYSKDSSTSAEKEDQDTITAALAGIGKSGSVNPTTPKPTTPQPTTQKPTTPQPTTQKPTTQLAAKTLTVNATSNLFPAKTLELAENAKTVTVDYDLKSAMKLVNGMWTLNYDASKLSFNSSKNPNLMPYVTDCITYGSNGVIKGAFTNVEDLYDFTSSKNFVKVTFDVIGTGTAKADLNVETLSVGYKSGNTLNFKNAVADGSIVNLSGTSGFTTSKLTTATNIVADQVATTAPATTAPVGDKLKVNATSNVFPTAKAEFNKTTNQVVVTYKLDATMDVVDAQWTLTYDPSVLKVSSAKNIMPNVDGAVINNKTSGTLKGNFSTVDPVTFSNNDFVKVVFNVVGTGETNVNLNVEYLSLGYISGGKLINKYIVDKGVKKNITGETGFSKAAITGKTTVTLPSSVIYGDVTGDGLVSVDDVTLVQKYIAVLVTFSDAQFEAGDCDHDGSVTIYDATLIQKYLANMVSSLD